MSNDIEESPDVKKQISLKISNTILSDIELLAKEKEWSLNYYIGKLLKVHASDSEKLLKTLRPKK